MTELSPDAQKTLECLRQVAIDTLERKRRLGHYAVFWRDGSPVIIGEDAPADYTQERRAWVDQTSLDDVLAAMRQHQDDDTAENDEVIEWGAIANSPLRHGWRDRRLGSPPRQNPGYQVRRTAHQENAAYN